MALWIALLLVAVGTIGFIAGLLVGLIFAGSLPPDDERQDTEEWM